MLSTLFASCLLAACGGGGGGGGATLAQAAERVPGVSSGPNNGPNCAAGALTCVEVTASASQSNVPLTFGQPFRSGDLSASQGLSAQDSSGNAVPVQMDEVATHPNGSVRFAVLSANLPSLGANAPRVINFFPAAKSNAGASVPADPAWNLEVTARLSDGTTLVAKPQAQLKQQIASGSGRRLNGPVAAEYTVVAPMVNASTGAAHPHLVARLHTRLYNNGTRFRTDVVMENNWALKSAPTDLNYSLTVTANGQTLLSQPAFTHHHKARWHKVLWSGAADPNVRVRHNMRYFLDSRATWNYDLGLNIPSSVLAAEASNLAKANTGPMGSAMLTTDMPMTGGRSEIAPLPRWTAMYLITQNDSALRSMLANADAAASAPVHYRDESTGQPLSVRDHPSIALRYGTSSPAVPTAGTASPWKPDIAHQGSYAYIPYLVTGDAFYLDELMFWAAWNIAANDPEYRGTSKDLLNSEQVRGQSWGLRSIAEASFAAPDSHALNAYFDSALANNMSWFEANYNADPKKASKVFSPMGAIISLYNDDQAPSYEGDFFATVMSWLAENNVPNASSVLNSVGRMQIDRFLASTQKAGFCTSQAAGYWLKTKNGSAYVSDWGDFYRLNYGSAACANSATDGYPDWAGGYVAVARAMLAAASNAGANNASEAYARWKSFSPLLETAARGFPSDPSYAVVPR